MSRLMRDTQFQLEVDETAVEVHKSGTRSRRSALRGLGPARNEGDDHATRRQIELYRQAETPGRTYRGRLRVSGHRQERSRTARLGDGQQGDRRRQEAR